MQLSEMCYFLNIVLQDNQINIIISELPEASGPFSVKGLVSGWRGGFDLLYPKHPYTKVNS